MENNILYEKKILKICPQWCFLGEVEENHYFWPWKTWEPGNFLVMKELGDKLLLIKCFANGLFVFSYNHAYET